jgi:DNA-binding winged helix-turn-helix (wHTH) protein
MATVYRFDRFELLPQQRRLLEEGHPVPLGQRAFDALQALVERAPALVSKDALFAIGCPGVVVEENNLQVQVSTLRRILGTAAITTTPGRGYRFALELATADSPRTRAAPRHNLPPRCTRPAKLCDTGAAARRLRGVLGTFGRIAARDPSRLERVEVREVIRTRVESAMLDHLVE